MTEERKEQIKKEAKRRLDLWITNSTFDEMTQYGIFICFDKSLGMFQNPFCTYFEKRTWMRHKKFNTFITEDEFDLIDYQNIIYDLFKYAKKHWNETK